MLHFPTYFPMVWGVDLAVKRLSSDLILISGKVPVLEEDFKRGKDLYSSYLSSVRTHFAQKNSGGLSPHIRFANAASDQELLNFVEEYGPIAPIDVKQFRPEEPPGPPGASLQFIAALREERCATENISSLRRERRIYAAALGLLTELRKGEKKARRSAIRNYISEIVVGVEAWPDQWERESNWRVANCPFPIAWRFDSGRLDRLWNLEAAADWEPSSEDESLEARLGSALRMSTFSAGQLVLCELVNSFPIEIEFFDNHPVESLPVEAVSFGIRPGLYLLLRRECFARGGAVICGNDRCERFFTSERAGQSFCSPVCSQQSRQRKYWSTVGSKKRKARRRAAKRLSRNKRTKLR